MTQYLTMSQIPAFLLEGIVLLKAFHAIALPLRRLYAGSKGAYFCYNNLPGNYRMPTSGPGSKYALLKVQYLLTLECNPHEGSDPRV